MHRIRVGVAISNVNSVHVHALETISTRNHTILALEAILFVCAQRTSYDRLIHHYQDDSHHPPKLAE